MRYVLSLLVVVAACSRAHVSAQLATARESERIVDSGHVQLTGDLNTFVGHADQARYVFVQPTAIAALRLREVVIEAALPFAYAHERLEGDAHNRVALGNPWLGLAYLPDCMCGLSRVSLGVAYDASRSDSPLAREVSSLARGAMGDWDGYLWIDHMLPLVAGASTRMDVGMLRLSWDGDLIFGLPAATRAFEFGTQHAGELALVLNWHWQLAGRVSAVYYPTLPGDNFQSALAFYLRYVILRDAVGARFLMNLDGPHGFAFTREGMWGLGVFYSSEL